MDAPLENTGNRVNKSVMIEKAFTVIRAFVDIKPKWGVRELSKYLNIPVSSAHRILKNLTEEDILQFNSTLEKYEIGIEFIRISSSVSSKVNIKKITKKYLERLSNKFGETICLVLYDSSRKKVVFIDKVSGTHPLQYVINIGELQSTPYGASGKAILAFLPNEEIQEIFDAENFSLDKQDAIRRELINIAKKGYAFTQGERIVGSKGIAAPIFNGNKYPLGSLILTVPIDRFDPNIKNEVAHEIMESAKEISKVLGYHE